MTVDRLTSLFDRFRVSAQMFHAGALCGRTHFGAAPGLGFVHVLRDGTLNIEHRKARGGPPHRMTLTEPSLIFYPRPLDHDFIYPGEHGSQLVCATLRFEGGAMHPIARGLPPLVVVPLSQAPSLAATLELLFAEADHMRCGRPLLANRLFEVLLIQLLRWLLDRDDLPEGLLAGLADPQLSRALVAMHDQPAHPWDLPALAERAGMSRSAFAAAFKRVVGDTPAEHLAQWRLALAQQRLARGDAIKRVALDVGYGSASALSRAFAARVGASPRAWLAAQAEAAAG